MSKSVFQKDFCGELQLRQHRLKVLGTRMENVRLFGMLHRKEDKER